MNYIISDLEFILFEYLGEKEVVYLYTIFSKNVDIYIKKCAHRYFNTTNDMSNELKWVYSLNVSDRITKKDSKKYFRVTDNQIKRLKYVIYNENSFKFLKKLYNTQDVARLCFERHINIKSFHKYDNQLKRQQKDRENRVRYFEENTRYYLYILPYEKKHFRSLFSMSKKIPLHIFLETLNIVEESRKNRKNLLTTKLYEIKINFSNENSLCYDYVYKNKYNIDIVVRKMCEEKYLNEYCNLQNIYDNYYNDFDNWIYNNILTRDEATYIALSYTPSGRFPDIFPWMEE